MFKIAILTMAFVITSWSQTSPQLKNSALDMGYIPNGFDSNDQAQIVVEGTYRDTCSKPAGTRFTVNEATKTIQLSTYEYRYSGPCLDMLVPHDEVVNLGIVNAGLYQVVQSSGRSLGRLNVVAATKQSPDDFLYAPVSQAYARNVNGQLLVTVSGSFSNSCMRLQKVQAHVQTNVVTVQPLAQLAQGPCVAGNFPFEQTTAVNAPRSGRYLLHVRSLNGKSINNLFDIR